MLLKDKTVIVTGGSRGIGSGIVIACAKAGADVVINYYGNNDAMYNKRSAIDGIIAEVEAHGRKAVAIEGNIADPETGKVLVATAVKHFGKVDVLAANAGICQFHTFLDMPADILKQTTDVNLHGVYFAAQAAANQMIAQGTGGAIVATSSIGALVGGGMQTHYNPTKSAVHSLMQSCAIALGPHGIRCNSVMPGAILTDLNVEDLSDPVKRDYMTKRIPLGRFGAPDDIGDCVVFLASDMARYVNGASLLIDGGMFVNLQ
jgi:L-rhamnose 1-dehydrogenase